jgi:hypothetical protein
MAKPSAFAKLKAEETPPPVAVEPARRRGTNDTRQPNRVGLKTVIFYEEPDVAVEMKVLAARQQRTIQAMMREALNDLFAKYGLEKPARATDAE